MKTWAQLNNLYHEELMSRHQESSKDVQIKLRLVSANLKNYLCLFRTNAFRIDIGKIIQK